jgi:Raf kinase inhibitor-like YbhB/YbcL family protein
MLRGGGVPRRAGLAAVASVVVAAVVAGCTHRGPAEPARSAPMTITVTSTAFAAGEPIPTRYSCRGANTSPPLRWTGIPAQAAALALVTDDPDAPGGTYRHWIVVDVPPRVAEAPAGLPPRGGLQLPNSAGHAGYDGPCPPSGTHHYRFTVYALGHTLDLPVGATLDQSLRAIDEATVARGQLTGTFSH